LLVARGDIEKIARDAPQSPDELTALLDLAPWRRDLVIEPLWAFLGGERVLRIAGYREGSPRTTWETVREEAAASE
jgi:hypothetical protein